jgi:outer membrane receptor for ferrienterochelin and colicins
VGDQLQPHLRAARARGIGGALLLSLAALLPLGLLAPAPALAEETCDASLQSAIALYEQGQFDAARDAASSCLRTGARRAEKVQAYAVIARVELALDHVSAAQAALRKILDADPEFQPEIFDAPRFARLLAEVRRERQAPVVSSVSKSVESLREAPATVILITADEIRRRGYVDFEAVLRDLPGFDFSRRAGASYSNIYQRGYRSLETNRTLILVDGVEDNDLASGTAWITRQIALSNIDRIEVVYGPASTMYGANAFAGVVNIITKDPRGLVREGRRLGVDARGAFDFTGDGALDATVAGQSAGGDFGWSVTARRWKGDDLDQLVDYPDWDFDPAFYATVDYQARPSLNVTDPRVAQALVARHTEAGVSRYYDIVRDAQGQVAALKLNANGASAARLLDQGALSQTVAGESVGFGEPVDDWEVYGKIQTANFTFGLEHWSTKEPSNVPLVDTYAASGKNGFLWTPRHTFLFAKYARRFADDKLSMTSFTQYKRHDLDGTNSANVFLRNYQLGSLGASDLLDDKAPSWNATYNYRSNDQIRTELTLYYEQSEKLNGVGGVELRLSSVGAKNVTSTTENPGETGSVPSPIAGDNQLASRDLAAYLQASYRPWQPLKVVLGGRFDNNHIRDTGGFGTVFNPRVALVDTWRQFVFKGVFARAFQDAPNFQKFETVPGVRELANPTLAPERVTNYELSASWRPRSDFDVQLVAYRANYEGIVAEVSGVPCPPTLSCQTTNQFQNAGSLEIGGLQGEVLWTPGAFRVSGNYTYARPRDPDRDLRVGDIASNRVNLQGGYAAGKLEVEMRLNWVIGRVTGKGTTVDRSPYTEIPNYAILGGAVTYRRLVPGVDLQLSVENLFDSQYYDPSLRNPSGFPIAARIPQPGRVVYLQLRATR